MSARKPARKRSAAQLAQLIEAARPHIDWLGGMSGPGDGMTTAFLAVDALALHYTAEQQLAKIAQVVRAGKGGMGQYLDHLKALEDIVCTCAGVTPPPDNVIDLGAWRAAKKDKA